jgi:prepilin-type N-terminal cleavage/methylation domain-containing protein
MTPGLRIFGRNRREGASGRPRGFTLLEILIAVAIVGILAAIVLARLSLTGLETKKKMCAQYIAQINVQVERWYFDKGEWPQSDLSDIASDPNYFPEGFPTCPVDGSSYQLDDASKRVAAHSH